MSNPIKIFSAIPGFIHVTPHSQSLFERITPPPPPPPLHPGWGSTVRYPLHLFALLTHQRAVTFTLVFSFSGRDTSDCLFLASGVLVLSSRDCRAFCAKETAGQLQGSVSSDNQLFPPLLYPGYCVTLQLLPVDLRNQEGRSISVKTE